MDYNHVEDHLHELAYNVHVIAYSHLFTYLFICAQDS